MALLETRYLGQTLANPLVASASPLTRELVSVRELEDAGVSAVVVQSFFQEEISYLGVQRGRSKELDPYGGELSFFPEPLPGSFGPEEHIERVQRICESVQIPVIASVNGTTGGAWLEYTSALESVGVAAIELNIHSVPADPEVSATQVEQELLAAVRQVRAEVSVPLSVKLSPFYSALAHLCRSLVDAGADGLVLFNRFYQPDLDLRTFKVSLNLQLSDSWELRLPLRWIAILRDVLSCHFAATTGIQSSSDVLKLIAAGADVTMLCSVLMNEGPAKVGRLLQGLETWLDQNGYESLNDLRAVASQRHCSNPAAFERANYMRMIRPA